MYFQNRVGFAEIDGRGKTGFLSEMLISPSHSFVLVSHNVNGADSEAIDARFTLYVLLRMCRRRKSAYQYDGDYCASCHGVSPRGEVYNNWPFKRYDLSVFFTRCRSPLSEVSFYLLVGSNGSRIIERFLHLCAES